MPCHDDRLDTSRDGAGMAAMMAAALLSRHHIGRRALKRSVQAAHKIEKRTRKVQSNLKALRAQFLAEHANQVKAVDGRGVAPVALQSTHRGCQLFRSAHFHAVNHMRDIQRPPAGDGVLSAVQARIHLETSTTGG